jgi:SAM-dependent methyltransferase
MNDAIPDSIRRRSIFQDAAFDQVFPPSQRFRSWMHWTPVPVALRATALLAPGRGRRVLDVGSGVGKLCLIGAATTTSTWCGIERDAEMVRAAKLAAMRMHVEHRTRFVHGDITSIDWMAFDAFYLFNPFGDFKYHLFDDALARRERYVANVEFVQIQLAHVAPGTRVVTYHGFGGNMPPGFDRVHREPAHEGELCVWVKRPRRTPCAAVCT